MANGAFPLEYDSNLLRFIGAELYSLLFVQAAREMFSKGAFSLSGAEYSAVNDAVFRMVQNNYQGLTPERLKEWLPSPPGGQAPSSPSQGADSAQRRKGQGES